RIAAYLYVATQELRGVFEFFVCHAQVCELQKRFGKIWVGLQRSLKKRFRGGMIALPFFDITHVEKTGSVAAIEFQTFLKVFLGFVEAPEMAVRKANECIGSGGRLQRNQRLELFDSFFRFAGHEIAFAERGAQVGAFWGDLQT